MWLDSRELATNNAMTLKGTKRIAGKAIEKGTFSMREFSWKKNANHPIVLS